jgi:hypothetical protein
MRLELNPCCLFFVQIFCIFEIMIPNSAAKNPTLFDGDMPVSNAGCLGDKISKIIATRKRHTKARNERIISMFNHKYNVERKRYDDVIKELCDDFSLAKSTIETAIKG